MKPAVLFVHNGFPGQFRDLAATLAARGVDCVAIAEAHASSVAGVRLAPYEVERSSTPGILPMAAAAEADLIRAKAAYGAAIGLKAGGFEPQVIVGHTGWGETLFLDEVFPHARQVLYPEYFPQAHPPHVGFDPQFGGPDEAAVLSAAAQGATTALALTDAHAIVCPTRFQADTLPPPFRARTRIIHEGVDVERLRPGPAPALEIPGGPRIAPGAPVITHINNHLEPLRGLHILARALPRVLAEVPEVQVLVFGHETARGYAGPSPEGRTWKSVALEGVALDPARVHFLGHVPHDQMLATLRASSAHVYYSYPFVLSWSVLEAMALGAFVVGSDTAPVREVIEDGVNGRLLPFFDADALSEALIAACRDPEASAPLRAAARATVVDSYSAQAGRAAWFELLAEAGLEIPGR